MFLFFIVIFVFFSIPIVQLALQLCSKRVCLNPTMKYIILIFISFSCFRALRSKLYTHSAHSHKYNVNEYEKNLKEVKKRAIKKTNNLTTATTTKTNTRITTKKKRSTIISIYLSIGWLTDVCVYRL